MVRVSNILIGLLNFITLVISIPFVGALLWYKSDDTVKLIFWPFFSLGLFVLIQSLLGLFGACCRVNIFLWIYLFVAFLLILVLSGFLIFGFVVTNKGVGDVLSDKGFAEYKLGNYSKWMQNHVTDGEKWSTIKANLKNTKLCAVPDNVNADLANAADLAKKDMTPMQFGCCKPPISCGYTFVNATYWTTPKSVITSNDKDCKTWSNDQGKLCYDCDSCKAGFLQFFKNMWKKVSVILGSFLGFLVIVYSIGCCALRNNKATKYDRYQGSYH